MSTTGIAAQEINLSLKSGFLHNGRGLRNLEGCCRGRDSQLGSSFFSPDSVSMAYNLNSAQNSLTSIGQISCPDPQRGHSIAGSRSSLLPLRASPSLLRPLITLSPEDGLILGVSGLSLSTSRNPDEMPPHTPEKSGALLCPPVPSNERSARPLPPLPVAKDLLHDEEDREVEFLTSSDTDFLLDTCSSSASKFTIQGRRSFRGCGQVNYAYFDAPAEPKPEQCDSPEPSGCADGPCPPPPPLHPLHRRLRRSHSGPAGSFNKPAIKVSSHFRQASPSSDEEKPEVPPRVPLPPRPLKSDSRRWSAEVASGAYSDEDRPPKVPPREPLSWSHSRTPSPKSLPAYLHGVMPPTQSFAPDPKYVSSKALQRQHSEGSAHKIPCILPIIENGKKVSSTHYYLLPERPPYLDKYEMFFRETEEGGGLRSERQPHGGETARLDRLVEADLGGPIKRNPLPCMVSP